MAAVSRVTCHAAAVMCNVAPLGAAQWAAVDRRPHGVSIAAHCALLIVSPHTTPPPAPARTDGSSLAAAANVGVDKAKSFKLLYYCMDTLNKNWNE